MNERLKLALLQAGVPQYTIAATAGMSETRLSRICLSRIVPTELEVQRIASALQRPAAELFGGDGNPEQAPHGHVTLDSKP